MADRPILFSGPMVRALLAGTKTQTRRVLRVKPGTIISDIRSWVDGPNGARRAVFDRDQIADPRIAVGDRLYVREHWRTGGQHDHIAPRDLPQEWAEPIGYIADEAPNTISRTGRFRQGMHMPRWASRITLTVTDVRVERLQDISEADAVAEGIERRDGCWAIYNADGTMRCGGSTDPVEAYRCLWININGAGSWDANPWVTAYTFTAQHGNVDEVGK